MLAALRSPILIEPTQCAVHAPERVIIAHLGAHVMLIHPFMNAEELFRIREPGSRRNRGSQLGQIAKIVSLGAVEVGGFDQGAASVLEGDRDIPQSRAAYRDDLIMRATRNRELVGARVLRWRWRVGKEVRIVDILHRVRLHPRLRCMGTAIVEECESQ